MHFIQRFLHFTDTLSLSLPLPWVYLSRSIAIARRISISLHFFDVENSNEINSVPFFFYLSPTIRYFARLCAANEYQFVCLAVRYVCVCVTSPCHMCVRDDSAVCGRARVVAEAL